MTIKLDFCIRHQIVMTNQIEAPTWVAKLVMTKQILTQSHLKLNEAVFSQSLCCKTILSHLSKPSEFFF